MKALSIRQPWAHMIIHGGKDIENRTWKTKLRGRFLVHASKGMTKQEYQFVVEYCARRELPSPPPYDQLKRGGVIGTVELVDCIYSSDSPWYMGDVGFVLANPSPLQFIECPGRLGFYSVTDDVLLQAKQGGAA